MNFIHENFLLETESARRLYHDYAEDQPIFDFHSHLEASEFAQNRRFRDLFEIWLEGDHYKWRAMRANGVAEKYITGDASPHDKYLAWARTVPFTLRNPLYHWTQLELKRYFGIDDLMDERSAEGIWKKANALLQSADFSALGIIKKFKVRVICSSDDPCSSLEFHKQVNASNPEFRVFPSFRPDPALAVDAPEAFNAWVSRLESTSGKSISSLAEFLDALKARHDAFHAAGCRLSDHGLIYCHANPCSEERAKAIFAKVHAGQIPCPEEHDQFASFMMIYFGRLDAERNWVKQLHLGALRSANTRALRELGPNTGFDSVGDWPQAVLLNRYLDLLENENSLPKMVIYNLNPAENYAFSTAAGNFQDESIAGKIQFGSGWWFLDQKEGIEWQLNTLSATGLLSRFVGMVTDSRSFMSFPRHEYFRRVLCNLLGNDMEKGLLPNDEVLIGTMVRNISYKNAYDFFGLDLSAEAMK
ncbi:MAG TPA: glucuronate isomerase [Terriglobales bacterium]|nr:glucuronate isomerase [Terriglobales bacterium]